MAAFDGFTSNTLALLDELPALDKSTYEARKAEIVAATTGPAKALAAELGERLTSVSPTLVYDARRAVSPLHRDLRFSKDKSTLYKDHLMLNFWDGSVALRMRIWSEGIGIATGTGFEKAALDAWREAVAGRTGEELERLLADLRADVDHVSVSDPELKRVPKGYDADHARKDLLRRKSFQVRVMEDIPASFTDASFVGWGIERFERLGDIHRLLTSL